MRPESARHHMDDGGPRRKFCRQLCGQQQPGVHWWGGLCTSPGKNFRIISPRTTSESPLGNPAPTKTDNYNSDPALACSLYRGQLISGCRPGSVVLDTCAWLTSIVHRHSPTARFESLNEPAHPRHPDSVNKQKDCALGQFEDGQLVTVSCHI
jgi:hypothetical protein